MNKFLTEVCNSWHYPGGELGVRQTGDCSGRLLARIQSSDDLIRLLMWLDAAYRSGGDVPERVFIPYLPYARQDRVAVDGDPLAVEVLAFLLASTNAELFETLDAHSQAAAIAFRKTGLVLENLESWPYLGEYLKRAEVDCRLAWFVAPDAGAAGKVAWAQRELGALGVIHCEKLRDSATGKLSGFRVIDGAEHFKPGDSLVVVDDICDGGGTFVGIAAALAAHFNTHHPLHLFTTHGIYSHPQGLFPLTYAGYRTIGSTDSFLHGKTNSNLITISIQEAP